MAERSLASAVALPEPLSPESGLKRKSSISNADRKRRRLSDQEDHTSSQVFDQAEEPNQIRRTGGRTEERKRGQRLFGALLGTLSQSSSTPAQKRREDIEKRQQAKLKQQEEEYDELRRKKREELTSARRKEQRLYEREAMNTRHSNLLSLAQFLKTRTQPVLYYKLWQLRRADEDMISKQIEETEAMIAKETAEFAERYPPEEDEEDLEPATQPGTGSSEPAPPLLLPPPPPHHPDTDSKLEAGEITVDATDTVGSVINRDSGTELPRTDTTTITTITTTTTTTTPPSTTNVNTTAVSSASIPVEDSRGGHGGHGGHDYHDGDAGGEVVEEDKEDTVIY